MFFGLIPGPRRVAGAFMPRSRRRRNHPGSRPPVQSDGDFSAGDTAVICLGVLVGFAGGDIAVVHDIELGAALVIGLLIGLTVAFAGLVLRDGKPRASSEPHGPPPTTPGPSQPQPAPPPEPDLVQTHSGRKRVNREIPGDRPHPWRTWEG